MIISKEPVIIITPTGTHIDGHECLPKRIVIDIELEVGKPDTIEQVELHHLLQLYRRQVPAK